MKSLILCFTLLLFYPNAYCDDEVDLMGEWYFYPHIAVGLVDDQLVYQSVLFNYPDDMVIFSFMPDNFLIIAPYEEENISGLWSRKESEDNSYYIIDAEGDRLLLKMYPIDQDNILAVMLDENDREALATVLFARNNIADWGREQKPNLLGKWYAFTRFFIERDEARQLTLKTLRDYWENGEEHQPTDFVWEFQSENVLTAYFPEDDEETAIWEIDEETGLLFVTWKDGYREGNILHPVDENVTICVSQEVGLRDSDNVTVWTLIRIR